jgi:hypothetical protein
MVTGFLDKVRSTVWSEHTKVWECETSWARELKHPCIDDGHACGCMWTHVDPCGPMHVEHLLRPHVDVALASETHWQRRSLHLPSQLRLDWWDMGEYSGLETQPRGQALSAVLASENHRQRREFAGRETQLL